MLYCRHSNISGKIFRDPSTVLNYLRHLSEACVQRKWEAIVFSYSFKSRGRAAKYEYNYSCHRVHVTIIVIRRPWRVTETGKHSQITLIFKHIPSYFTTSTPLSKCIYFALSCNPFKLVIRHSVICASLSASFVLLWVPLSSYRHHLSTPLN